MWVRLKLAAGYLAAGGLFIAEVIYLNERDAHWTRHAAAAVVIGAIFAGYVTLLKCPHCKGKAFSRRWLVMPHIPRTCATCDRDFSSW